MKSNKQVDVISLDSPKTSMKPKRCGAKKVTQLLIDGKEYKFTYTEKSASCQSECQNVKILANVKKQAEEIKCLNLMHKYKFTVRDISSHQFTLQFLIRGAPESTLDFEYSALYPSDVPPKYQLNVPWIRVQTKKEIQIALRNIFSENFGRCFMYLWAEAIEEILKREYQDMKKGIISNEEVEEVPVEEVISITEEKIPPIMEGTTVKDRGSSFTPFLAHVSSIEEVRAVLLNLNSRRKVNTAWRNTFAYRFTDEKGKTVEFDDDGGEPKAGANLMTKLVNYGANNVLVFLSRKFGGKLLGSDRYKHLNDAADEVLLQSGFTPGGGSKSKTNKQQQQQSDKVANKKGNKKKK